MFGIESENDFVVEFNSIEECIAIKTILERNWKAGSWDVLEFVSYSGASIVGNKLVFNISNNAVHIGGKRGRETRKTINLGKLLLWAKAGFQYSKKKMTLAEIEKKLGYAIELVEEKKS